MNAKLIAQCPACRDTQEAGALASILVVVIISILRSLIKMEKTNLEADCPRALCVYNVVES